MKRSHQIGVPSPLGLRECGIILLSALFLFFIASLYGPVAHAGVTDNSVFELDGNSVAAVADDFDTIFLGPGGSYDHVFVDDSALPDSTHHAPSNKDFQPLSAWGCVVKPNVNNKLDIRHAYVATYAVNGEAVSYFGADRDSTSGDANIGFWFFQDKVECDPATGKFTGKKRNGDILIVSAFTGGGSYPGIDIYRWTDPTPLLPESGDETLALVSSGVDCQDPNTATISPNLCGTTNTAPIDVAWENATGRNPIAAQAFFEGGINLSFFLPDTCYRAFMSETRSSQSLDATLFDYVLAEIFTCGSISVEKVTNPNAAPQLFGFTTAGTPAAPNPPVSDAFQLKDNDPTHATMNLHPGLYSITETVPSGWDLTGAQCRGGPFGTGQGYTSGGLFALSLGDKVVCTFSNTEQPPVLDTTISVDKVTIPANDPLKFSFALGDQQSVIIDSFTLADADASHRSPSLQPGTYYITESSAPDWEQTGVSCRGGIFGDGAPYTNGGPIQISAGDNVVCTFVNTHVGAGATATIKVDKNTAPAGDPYLFDFTVESVANGGTDIFQMAHSTPVHATTGLEPGTYTLFETPVPGWTTSAICTGGPFGAGAPYANGDPFILNAGDQVFCTYVNLWPIVDNRKAKFTFYYGASRSYWNLDRITVNGYFQVYDPWFKLPFDKNVTITVSIDPLGKPGAPLRTLLSQTIPAGAVKPGAKKYRFLGRGSGINELVFEKAGHPGWMYFYVFADKLNLLPDLRASLSPADYLKYIRAIKSFNMKIEINGQTWSGNGALLNGDRNEYKQQLNLNP